MARRIAVIGSRSICNEDYSDPETAAAEAEWMFYHLDQILLLGMYLDPERTSSNQAVLSGGAAGVDRKAQEYAESNGIPFFLYKPYHLVDTKAEYTPRYFFTRNKQIVDNCDELVAFWDGTSHGAEDAIRFARKKKKPVTVLTPSDQDLLDFYPTELSRAAATEV